MKRFHVELAGLTAIALVLGAAVFLSCSEEDTTVIAGPDGLMVAIGMEEISSDCYAPTFAYAVVATVLNGGGSGFCQFYMGDGTVRTAQGPPYAVNHTWFGCGIDGDEVAGYPVRAVVTQSDGRTGEASTPFAPCLACPEEERAP